MGMLLRAVSAVKSRCMRGAHLLAEEPLGKLSRKNVEGYMCLHHSHGGDEVGSA